MVIRVHMVIRVQMMHAGKAIPTRLTLRLNGPLCRNPFCNSQAIPITMVCGLMGIGCAVMPPKPAAVYMDVSSLSG